jgi:hypothetical protein
MAEAFVITINKLESHHSLWVETTRIVHLERAEAGNSHMRVTWRSQWATNLCET